MGTAGVSFVERLELAQGVCQAVKAYEGMAESLTMAVIGAFKEQNQKPPCRILETLSKHFICNYPLGKS